MICGDRAPALSVDKPEREALTDLDYHAGESPAEPPQQGGTPPRWPDGALLGGGGGKPAWRTAEAAPA